MSEKIVVFSDLHGNVRQLEKISQRIREEGATYVVFAGDLGLTQLGGHRDTFYSLSKNLITVRGNIDQPWVFMTEGIKVPLMYTSVTVDGRKIAVTHGDYFPTWSSLPIQLTDRDIFISGHTHVPSLVKLTGQPALINPGSVSSSRSEFPESYASIDGDTITIRSVEDGTPLDTLALSIPLLN